MNTTPVLDDYALNESANDFQNRFNNNNNNDDNNNYDEYQLNSNRRYHTNAVLINLLINLWGLANTVYVDDTVLAYKYVTFNVCARWEYEYLISFCASSLRTSCSMKIQTGIQTPN